MYTNKIEENKKKLYTIINILTSNISLECQIIAVLVYKLYFNDSKKNHDGFFLYILIKITIHSYIKHLIYIISRTKQQKQEKIVSMQKKYTIYMCKFYISLTMCPINKGV